MRCSNLAGSKKIDLIRDSIPSTAMPSNRNGSSTSHTIGYSTMARIASGAHSTNRINQSKNVTITFVFSYYLPLAYPYIANDTSDASLVSKRELPIKNSSTLRAHSLPSLMAHTTSDCPRRISPAVNTLGMLV
mgnify:CR=1 FL=1